MRRLNAIICHFRGHTEQPIIGERRETGENIHEVDLTCGRNCGYGYTLEIQMEFINLQPLAPPLQPGETRKPLLN